MESVIGTGSVICFLYHPYLVSFSIPICPLSQNSQDCSFTCIYKLDAEVAENNDLEGRGSSEMSP